MALAIAHSRGLDGLQAPPVTVEVHLASGLPSFTLVGLPDTEVKEARDRVRAAIVNSGFEFPAKRITVNLAPADLPKVQNILLFENGRRYLRMFGANCDRGIGD
jgi:magnesium chelatase family protein